MSQVSDSVLKSYFQAGDQPLESQFEDLIDSKLSVADAVMSTFGLNFKGPGYNAVGDGISDDLIPFLQGDADLVAAGGGTGFTPTGTYRLSGDVTFSPGVQIRMDMGAMFTAAVPITITFTEIPILPLAHVFGTNVSVVFLKQPLDGIYPDWFGAYSDRTHVTETNAAFIRAKACVDALPSADTLNGQMFGTLRLSSGVYLLSLGVPSIHSNQRLKGDGGQTSFLEFEPSSELPCVTLSEADPTETCYLAILEGFTIQSTTVQKKIGIRLNDVSEPRIRDVKINLGTSTGHDNIGVQIRGRQIVDLRGMTISADRPIRVEGNPNAIYDCDHFHLHDMYMVAHVTQPVVEIASGVNVSNIILDGEQSWIGGKHGFYWNDTAANDFDPLNVVIKNARWEQNTDTTGYFIYIKTNRPLLGLILENIYGGLGANGFYFRNVRYAHLVNIQYNDQSGHVGLDCDATCKYFHFVNAVWGVNTLFNLTGFVYYNSLTPSGVQCKTVTIADDANAQLPFVAGHGNGTAAVVMVLAGGGKAGLFNLLGSNDTVVLISDPGSAFTVNLGPLHATSDGKTNIYWSSARSRYEIENRQGGGWVYSIYLFIDMAN